MLLTANKINYENNTDLNTNNVKYFLTGDTDGLTGTKVDHNFKMRDNGEIKSNIALSRATKEQLRKMYNDLTGYINSDVDSSSYDERQKVAKEKFIKFVNDDAMENEKGFTITDEDAEEMFKLKDEMPELFDSSSVFYELVVIGMAEYREKNGTFDRSLLRIALEEKKKLQKSGEGYTMEDLKKNILKNIETGRKTSTYDSKKKKDRKSARLNRKAKRNKKRG